MCWHQWTKWEQFKVKVLHIEKKTGKTYEFTENRQSRRCIKCGYVQEQEVSYW